MSMYIVTHKEFQQPVIEEYIPIQVGKLITKKELGYISDDTGINISKKNDSYCELTALYWIWQNCKDEFVGICHYRRYFTTNAFSNKSKYYISWEKAINLLKRYDIILPQKIYLKSTVEEKYAQNGAGFIKDLKNIEKIISYYYPEYIDTYNKVMNGSEQYFWNMFIAKKDLIDKYCEWLFDVLGKLEEITDLTTYNSRQKRIYGYISERLFNVWLLKYQVKIYECPVIQSDKSLYHIIKSNLGIKLKHRKY